MDIEEFEDLIDRLGEDVSQWPSPHREHATALLQASSEAREIQSEAAALRRALTGRTAVKAPAGLADRIVARAVRESPVRGPTGRPATAVVARTLPSRIAALHPALLLSLCFLVGMTVGMLPLQPAHHDSQVDFPTLLLRLGR